MRAQFRLYLIGSYGASAVGTYAHCYTVLSRTNAEGDPFTRHFSSLAYATYFPVYWTRKLYLESIPSSFLYKTLRKRHG